VAVTSSVVATAAAVVVAASIVVAATLSIVDVGAATVVVVLVADSPLSSDEAQIMPNTPMTSAAAPAPMNVNARALCVIGTPSHYAPSNLVDA